MNITLPIFSTNTTIDTKTKVNWDQEATHTVTFYSIDAISPFKDTSHSIIYSGGKEFICEYSYETLWDKLK
jgi:hypothetical protein